MFNNIGKKIKTLAVIICVIGMVIFVVAGMLFMVDGMGVIIGLLVMIVGCLASWIGSFFAYGFGELIDKTCEIAESNRKDVYGPTADINDRMDRIRSLRQQGLISENEYRDIIAKIQNGYNTGTRI